MFLKESIDNYRFACLKAVKAFEDLKFAFEKFGRDKNNQGSKYHK